jgi:hypothetical protein
VAYRDDLEAARARVEQLEAELQLANERMRGERDALERRIAGLEGALRAARTESAPARVWGIALAGAASVSLLFALAFALLTRRSEAGGWEMANLAIASGLLVPAWAWGRAGRTGAWLVGLTFKLLVLVVWGWGWWSPSRSDIRHIGSSLGPLDAEFYFLWWAPVFVFLTVIVEGVGVRWSMTRATTSSSAAP